MEEVIVGVVGVLQFDVLKYRLENEYNVEIRMDTLPYEHIRWIENEDIDMDKLVGTSDMKKIQDLKGRPLLLVCQCMECRHGIRPERRSGTLGVRQGIERVSEQLPAENSAGGMHRKEAEYGSCYDYK